MTILHLQDEVDVKAIKALEVVMDSVYTGSVHPEDGRYMLAILQSAFAGITSDKSYMDLLTDADTIFMSLPKPSSTSQFLYFITDDTSLPPVYVMRQTGRHLQINKRGQIIKDKTFDTPSECYTAMLKAHETFIDKGLFNLCR